MLQAATVPAVRGRRRWSRYRVECMKGALDLLTAGTTRDHHYLRTPVARPAIAPDEREGVRSARDFVERQRESEHAERELAKLFVDYLSLVTASNHCCIEVRWSLFVVYALDVERDSDLGTVVAKQLRKV